MCEKVLEAWQLSLQGPFNLTHKQHKQAAIWAKWVFNKCSTMWEKHVILERRLLQKRK